MTDRDDVLDHPVQQQSGGGVVKHEEEHDRHTVHHELAGHPALRRAGLVDAERENHRSPVEDGQQADVASEQRQGNGSEVDDRFGQREVLDPPGDEHGSAQFEVLVQQSIQGDENRELEQQRQAAAQRIDLFALVQFSHLLVELGGVVLVAGPQLLHLGIECLHLGGRLHALLAARLQDDL
ncbi:hypothetical protein SDC9_163560 [bioreactor metagenome]|uniref:Uncharacterized protein n=1 Tax=bioreactor metagenome TaxID=1076179 RepID=A0A645FRH7_9ZZZZ